MIPAFSMAENSSLTAANFSGSSLPRFSKNWKTRIGEEMVSHSVVRIRGRKTVGGENIWKIF